MKKWTSREKVLLLVSLLLLVLVAGKSLLIDGYEPKDDFEARLVEDVLEEIGQSKLTSLKVVKVRKLSGEQYEDIDLEHGYSIVVRKYFLRILPYREMRILV